MISHLQEIQFEPELKRLCAGGDSTLNFFMSVDNGGKIKKSDFYDFHLTD